MSSLSNERIKLVTNFIIVPAPVFKPPQETMPSPLTKREESPHSSPKPEIQEKIEEASSGLHGHRRKRYPKDDYQKNITINVVKCCIREIISTKYRRLLQKRCKRSGVNIQALVRMVSPILKQVVISLGDLKKMLTYEGEQELKLKNIFLWFLEWYLRNRYMFYLLNEGKMNHKERYIDYKNKYMLYLLMLIKEERIDEIQQLRQHDTHDKQHPLP